MEHLDPDQLTAMTSEQQAVTLLLQGKSMFRTADGADWLGAFSDRCDEVANVVSIDALRTATSDLAWWLRARRDDDDDLAKARQPDLTDPSGGLARTLVVAQLLRYDLRFGALRDVLRTVEFDDALIRALELFARLGLNRDVPIAEVHELRARRDCDVKALHCVMHGLCLSHSSHQHAGLILDIGEELRRRLPSPDPVLEYRVGIGHRLAGNFDRAEFHLAQALSLVPPDNSVHQQFAAELQMVRASREFTDEVARQSAVFAASLDTLRDEALSEIDVALRGGLTANFQILAIFLTLAGFLGTAGVTIVRLAEAEISWTRGVATLGILVVFTFAVLVASRLLMEFRIKRRDE